MSSGTELVGGRIPGEIIGTPTIVTSDSSGFTSETVVATLEVPVVAGRTYKVRFSGRWGAASATADIVARIREDDINGTQIQVGQVAASSTSTLGFGPMNMTAFWPASTTENQTFVIAGIRNGGTGTCRLDASPATPALLWVEYAFG
jgi:hypothetical protein